LQRIAILTLQQLAKNDRLKAAMQKDCVPLFLAAISSFKSSATLQHVYQVAQLGMHECEMCLVLFVIVCFRFVLFCFVLFLSLVFFVSVSVPF
jgi:hypothetical protein